MKRQLRIFRIWYYGKTKLAQRMKDYRYKENLRNALIKRFNLQKIIEQ